MASAIQPNPTLYVNNLNDKVNKDELRSQLFALFTTYGKIIDIIASKSQHMRGQAFLVFTDLAGATSAMRACEGMVFYDKPLVSLGDHPLSTLVAQHVQKHIAYAKTKSHATSRREDPMFVAPKSANASALLYQNGKRQRDEENVDGERNPKREKSEEKDDEEMEIDDEDDTAQANKPSDTNSCTSYCSQFNMLGFTIITKYKPQPWSRLLFNTHQHGYFAQTCRKKLPMRSLPCCSSSMFYLYQPCTPSDQTNIQIPRLPNHKRYMVANT